MRATDQYRQFPARRDFFNQARCIIYEVSGRIYFAGIAYIYEMMRDSAHLRTRYFLGANIQSAIHLPRIYGDNFSVSF